jgi:transcription elongation factor S-II
MPTLSTVLVSIKGEPRKAQLQLTSDSDLTLEILQKYFKKKDEPENVCYYEYDNKIIFIFGYKKGKKGTENKIELPEPYTDTVLFGDALVIVSLSHKWENPIPFTVDQWNTFCNCVNSNQNEENSDSEDEDEDEDDEEVISDAGESVKDAFDDEEEDKTSIIENEEEEAEEAPPVVVKRRKATACVKVDIHSIKEQIPLDSTAESHKLRTLCLNNLKFLEAQFSNEDIRLLEKGIFESAYNYAKKWHVARSWKSNTFIELYRQVVRSVIGNIHPDSPVKNPRLLNRVLEGEFKLGEIPSMTSYEMFPEKWFELKDKLLQREQKILEGNKSRATDQFKCRRCHKRECTYYELQTRSADEPMTIFITCLNCGKEWRQGG